MNRKKLAVLLLGFKYHKFSLLATVWRAPDTDSGYSSAGFYVCGLSSL